MKDKINSIENSKIHRQGQNKLFMLCLIVLLALIVSIFTGSKKAISLDQAPLNNEKDTPPPSHHLDNFMQKMQQQTPSDESTQTTMVFIDDKNDKDPEASDTPSNKNKSWQRRESLRALKSRRSPIKLGKQREHMLIPLQSSFPQSKADSPLSSYKFNDNNSQHTYTIPIGTIIPINLSQDISSDHPGPWLGQLSSDIYDIAKNHILVPKGSKVIGESISVSKQNQMINTRIALTLDYLILPTGKKISMQSHSLLDRSGFAAVNGMTNQHLTKKLLSTSIYAFLSASMPRDQYNTIHQYQSTLKGNLADGFREQGEGLINPYLSLVPTVIIKAGTPVNLLVKHDIQLFAWSLIPLN